MNHLSKMRLRNYMSLESVELTFGNFTVLVGASNVGKSAVIRAIHTFLNNSRGSDMLRHGKDDSAVVLFIDGIPLTWYRHKTKGVTYLVHRVKYEKLGTDIPQAVCDIVKMTDRDVGGVAVNFNVRRQFDGLFFLSETGPSKAKILGHISGYDIVQKSVKTGLDENKRHVTEIKVLNDQVTRQAKILEQAELYSTLERQLADVDMLYTKLVVWQKVQQQYTELLQQYQEYFHRELVFRAQVQLHIGLVSMVADHNSVQQQMSTYDKLCVQLRELKQLQQQLVNVYSATSYLIRQIEQVSSHIHALSAVRDRTSRYRELCQYLVGLQNLYVEWHRLKVDESDMHIDWASMSQEIIEGELERQNIIDMLMVCPICGAVKELP